MFKETNEGQTHSYNNGCGEPAHNKILSETELNKESEEEGKMIRKVLEEECECKENSRSMCKSCASMSTTQEPMEWELRFPLNTFHGETKHQLIDLITELIKQAEERVLQKEERNDTIKLCQNCKQKIV